MFLFVCFCFCLFCRPSPFVHLEITEPGDCKKTFFNRELVDHVEIFDVVESVTNVLTNCIASMTAPSIL